jgi:hypothetical protein
VARCTQSNSNEGRRMRVISCRDAFPKSLVADSVALSQKGKMLKDQGTVASFRVVARGPGCIPVLQVRDWLMDGSGRRSNKWTTYIEEENSSRGRASDRGRARLAEIERQKRSGQGETGTQGQTGTRNKTGSGGRGESGRKGTGDEDRRPVVPQPQGTPRKIPGSTRLSTYVQEEEKDSDYNRRRRQASTEEDDDIDVDPFDEHQEAEDEARQYLY